MKPGSKTHQGGKFISRPRSKIPMKLGAFLLIQGLLCTAFAFVFYLLVFGAF